MLGLYWSGTSSYRVLNVWAGHFTLGWENGRGTFELLTLFFNGKHGAYSDVKQLLLKQGKRWR